MKHLLRELLAAGLNKARQERPWQEVQAGERMSQVPASQMARVAGAKALRYTRLGGSDGHCGWRGGKRSVPAPEAKAKLG